MCERLGAEDGIPEPSRRSLLAALAGLALTGCAVARVRRRVCGRGSQAASVPRESSPSLACGPRPPIPHHVPFVADVEPVHSNTGEPWKFVTRAQWGASELRDNHDPMTPITRLTLHHTDTLDVVQDKSDAEFVKAVQKLHQENRGWADIGYHFLIGRDGKVYEGRRLDVQGAHAGAGNNGGNLGISVIGNFVDALPGNAQLDTLASFLRHQARRYDLSLGGLLAHRDLKETECPGEALYTWYGKRKAGFVG